MSKPQHYYSFTFQRLHEDGRQSVANSYLGLDAQKINRSLITYAMSISKIDMGAVLVSVSYLGYMTNEEFESPDVPQ